METKRTGISRELIIHPGETIADILEERSISQTDLATTTGVSTAYISNVLKGKKDISAKFALALEYALGVPKSFWINLQANYDAELLESEEENTITEEERTARVELNEVVRYLRKIGSMPAKERTEKSILSLRKALRVSNLANVKGLIPIGVFRMTELTTANPYVLGAWIRLCQINGESRRVENPFQAERIDELVRAIKRVMLGDTLKVQEELKKIFSQYGIDFSIGSSFIGAPVQGFVAPKNDGSYQMVLTIHDTHADVFWFSLFHELGHIVNGDIGNNCKFVDDGCDKRKEMAADEFARRKLISRKDYQVFIDHNELTIETISEFAKGQGIMPYMVISRLQAENRLGLLSYPECKIEYDWLIRDTDTKQ